MRPEWCYEVVVILSWLRLVHSVVDPLPEEAEGRARQTITSSHCVLLTDLDLIGGNGFIAS